MCYTGIMAGPKAEIPIDAEGNAVQITPSFVALEETYDTTISSSTEITLNTGTSFIEVSAITKPIFMKWGTDDATNADFDEFIQAGTSRQYYVPAGITAVNFLEQAATALLVVIEK